MSLYKSENNWDRSTKRDENSGDRVPESASRYKGKSVGSDQER